MHAAGSLEETPRPSAEPVACDQRCVRHTSACRRSRFVSSRFVNSYCGNVVVLVCFIVLSLSGNVVAEVVPGVPASAVRHFACGPSPAELGLHPQALCAAAAGTMQRCCSLTQIWPRCRPEWLPACKPLLTLHAHFQTQPPPLPYVGSPRCLRAIWTVSFAQCTAGDIVGINRGVVGVYTKLGEQRYTVSGIGSPVSVFPSYNGCVKHGRLMKRDKQVVRSPSCARHLI